MLKSIRAFFDARGVLEVETPQLSHYAVSDPHIDSLSVQFRNETFYLNSSPEYCMKRLLARQSMSIYQICRAFRDDTPGKCHNPEFSILEWYRPGYSLQQLMDEVVKMIQVVSDGQYQQSEFLFLSYQQAFEQHAGFNPHNCTAEQCVESALAHKIPVPEGMGRDDDINDWLDWLLTQIVLPALPENLFTFLYDYPASQAALAKIETGPDGVPVARRFELLYGELELANAFHELTDASEQAHRFAREQRQRQFDNKLVPTIDPNLIAALESGLDDCSGIAVGLDRLLMVLSGCTSIDDVLAFTWKQV